MTKTDLLDDFREEARSLSTKDLLLIIKDQEDLYSEEEFAILKEELESRPENALQIEEDEENARIIAQEKAEKKKLEKEREKQRQAVLCQRIDSLKKKGYEGYYEYKVLNLVDNKDGWMQTLLQFN